MSWLVLSCTYLRCLGNILSSLGLPKLRNLQVSSTTPRCCVEVIEVVWCVLTGSGKSGGVEGVPRRPGFCLQPRAAATTRLPGRPVPGRPATRPAVQTADVSRRVDGRDGQMRGHVRHVRRVDGQMVRRSDGQMVRWSDGQSSGQMVRTSVR